MGNDNRTVAITARGTDGGTHVRVFRNGRWIAWRSLGGIITAAPEIAPAGNGFVVSVRAANGGLYNRLLDLNGALTTGWMRLYDVVVNSNLQHYSAASALYYYRGTDGTLTQLAVPVGAVTSYGGVLTSGPDADNPGGEAGLGSPPALYIARGTNRALWILDTRTRLWRSLGGTVT